MPNSDKAIRTAKALLDRYSTRDVELIANFLGVENFYKYMKAYKNDVVKVAKVLKVDERLIFAKIYLERMGGYNHV